MKFENTDLFKKQLKKLSKKYKNIKIDILNFIENFDKFHLNAVKIKDKIFKVRIRNSSKNKGKRVGFRVYYYLKIEDRVILLVIYDKSEIKMIDEEILNSLIKEYKNV